MTINEAIERVDSLFPNPYSNEQKTRWLSELDGQILLERGDAIVTYTYPDDGETELLITAPYESLYCDYLISQMNLYQREIDTYNVYATMFRKNLDEYKKSVIRSTTHESVQFTNLM